jgi:hypothetical protein
MSVRSEEQTLKLSSIVEALQKIINCTLFSTSHYCFMINCNFYDGIKRMNQKAWSFKAVGKDDLRYFGNNGYHDDSTSFYQYDNFVPNHKQVKKGDIVIITDRNNVLGVSIIDNLLSTPYLKARHRCPYENCTPAKLTLRKSKNQSGDAAMSMNLNSPKSKTCRHSNLKLSISTTICPLILSP